MVNLNIDSTSWIAEEAPPHDISMPRVFRRPPMPPLSRGRLPFGPVIERAARAQRAEDRAGFGLAYGELTAEFQPAIQWAAGCWEYLLSTQGCRFLARTPEEKIYARGDYRVFLERDFQRFVYRAFKSVLSDYVADPPRLPFDRFLKGRFWPAVLESYKALEVPPDRRQRNLTGWSYLRCIPYQFLNDHHQERVHAAVREVPPPQRRVLDLYFLRFYREEAVLEETGMDAGRFERLRDAGLRDVAGRDYLSFILLTQIERY